MPVMAPLIFLKQYILSRVSSSCSAVVYVSYLSITEMYFRSVNLLQISISVGPNKTSKVSH